MSKLFDAQEELFSRSVPGVKLVRGKASEDKRCGPGKNDIDFVSTMDVGVEPFQGA